MQVFKFSVFFLFISIQAQASLFEGTNLESLSDFSTVPMNDLLGQRSLVVVFSKDCAHCKSHFKSLHQCYKGESNIIPISVDNDKKKVKKYWRSAKLPFPAWIGSKSFNKKFSALKKNLPYSYLYYGKKFYPIGAGSISCERIAQLSILGSKA